jgi:hypothetical protein
MKEVQVYQSVLKDLDRKLTKMLAPTKYERTHGKCRKIKCFVCGATYPLSQSCNC